MLDSGLAEDVIGLDCEAWAQLLKSTSLVWCNAANGCYSVTFGEATNARPDASLRHALTTAREVLSILNALDQQD